MFAELGPHCKERLKEDPADAGRAAGRRRVSAHTRSRGMACARVARMARLEIGAPRRQARLLPETSGLAPVLLRAGPS